MRCFLATALTAFFSFAWSDAEAATATGTFNVQVTIAPTRKISRAFGVLLLPAWFAASDASAATLQVAPVLLEVVAPGAAATVTLRNNGAKPIATQVHEEDPFGNRIKLLDVGYSRQLFGGPSFFATAYAGLDSPRNAGISLGLSIPLGGGVTASSGST